MTGPLLAHQGGWDEIALVATPIAIFAVLLWIANLRARKKLENRVTERLEADETGEDRGD